REAKPAKTPEHERIKGRAKQERRVRIAGTGGAPQHQPCRDDVAVLQIILSALEQCSNLRGVDRLRCRLALRDGLGPWLRLLLKPGLGLRLRSEFGPGAGLGIIE